MGPNKSNWGQRARLALLTTVVLVIADPAFAQVANAPTSSPPPVDPATAAAAADANPTSAAAKNDQSASGGQAVAVDPTKDAAAQAGAKEIVIQGRRFTDTGASSATKL